MNHLPLIRSSVLAAFVSAAFGAAAEPAPGLAAQKTLWQIGQSDANDGEFALAPDRYEAFEEDGLFIVGRSDAKAAWPYVHPGPDDAWAGQCEHAFVVLFGVKQPAANGNCRLLVDLLDTHKFKPVTLHLEIPVSAGCRSRTNPTATGPGGRSLPIDCCHSSPAWPRCARRSTNVV